MEEIKKQFEKTEYYKYSISLDPDLLKRLCNGLNLDVFAKLSFIVEYSNGMKITYPDLESALEGLNKSNDKIVTMRIHFEDQERFFHNNELSIDFINNNDSYRASIIIRWKLSDYDIYEKTKNTFLKEIMANRTLYSFFNQIPITSYLSVLFGCVLGCFLGRFLVQDVNLSILLIFLLAIILWSILIICVERPLYSFSVFIFPKIQFLFGNNIKIENRKGTVRNFIIITLVAGLLISVIAGLIVNAISGVKQ